MIFFNDASIKKKNFHDSYTFAAFQLRSLGTFPLGASKTITAAVTLVTAPGGEPNDLSSVRLALFRVFKASCAANNAGSAFTKSASQSFCFFETSSAITATFDSSSSANYKKYFFSSIFFFFFFSIYSINYLGSFPFELFQFQRLQWLSEYRRLRFSAAIRLLEQLILP